MKIFRVASALVLVFGLLMIAFGSVLLESVDRNTALLEYLQRGGMGRHIDAQALRMIVIRNAIGYVVIGLISTVSGIGLLMRRPWARWLWLGLLIATLGLITVDFLLRLWYSFPDARNVAAYVVTTGIVGLVGYYFWRPHTASYLRP